MERLMWNLLNILDWFLKQCGIRRTTESDLLPNARNLAMKSILAKSK